MIGYFDHYVAIEASVQRLPRGIALGHAVSNAEVCTRYHDEADQAQATADDLSAITSALALPRPAARSILVVTEQPIENTPALQLELQRQRPSRNPRFVCSASELEHLVDLAVAGWSFPGAVMAWQIRDSRRALSVDLAEMSRTLRGPIDPAIDQWLAILLPHRFPRAA